MTDDDFSFDPDMFDGLDKEDLTPELHTLRDNWLNDDAKRFAFCKRAIRSDLCDMNEGIEQSTRTNRSYTDDRIIIESLFERNFSMETLTQAARGQEFYATGIEMGIGYLAGFQKFLHLRHRKEEFHHLEVINAYFSAFRAIPDYEVGPVGVVVQVKMQTILNLDPFIDISIRLISPSLSVMSESRQSQKDEVIEYMKKLSANSAVQVARHKQNIPFGQSDSFVVDSYAGPKTIVQGIG